VVDLTWKNERALVDRPEKTRLRHTTRTRALRRAKGSSLARRQARGEGAPEHSAGRKNFRGICSDCRAWERGSWPSRKFTALEGHRVRATILFQVLVKDYTSKNISWCRRGVSRGLSPAVKFTSKEIEDLHQGKLRNASVNHEDSSGNFSSQERIGRKRGKG